MPEDDLRGQRLPGIPGHFSNARALEDQIEPRKPIFRFERLSQRAQKTLAVGWTVFILGIGVFSLIWQIVTGEGGGAG
jgi:hypothetical protein